MLHLDPQNNKESTGKEVEEGKGSNWKMRSYEVGSIRETKGKHCLLRNSAKY